MQFRSIILTAAVALTAVQAAGNCSETQLNDIKKLDDEAAFHKACPASDEDGSLDLETTDPKVWTEISPCKDAACAAYLKQQASKMPDCDHDGVNMKQFYKGELDLCVDLASGKLTPDEIKKRVENATADWAGSFGEWFDEDDTSGSGSMEEDVIAKVLGEKNTSVATSTTNTTNTTNSPNATNATNTTAPPKTPAPKTKKSSATTMVISGGVIAVTAALASLTIA